MRRLSFRLPDFDVRVTSAMLATLLAGCATDGAPSRGVPRTVEPDAGTPDATGGGDVAVSDTSVPAPDGAVEDAAVRRPDAARSWPDAAAPDASVPDAAVPDAAVPDATAADAAPDATVADAVPWPDLPDLETWPDAATSDEEGLSVLVEGRLLARGEFLDRVTGPAGLSSPETFELRLVWRGAEPLDTSDDAIAWLDDPFFRWESPPPTELLPEVPVTLRLVVDPVDVETGGHRRAVLRVPDAALRSRFEVGLHAAIAPPLRLVFSGDNGYTLTSDDYGRTVTTVIPPGAVARTMGPTTWGVGRFFRALRDGVAWESPGLYETSPDGVVWTPSIANPAFRSDHCVYAFDRFVCSREDVFSWSVQGDVIVHEAVRWQGLIQGMAFDGERIFAVGRGGRRAVSPDGITLTDLAPHPEAQWYTSVAAADGRVVAGGGNDRWVFSVTTDSGQTWRDAELCRSTYATVTSVGYVAGRWLLAGTTGNDGLCGSGIALSDDGERFVFPPGRNETNGLRLLGTHAGWLFAQRSSGPRHLMRTHDGETWEWVFELPAGANITSMALEGVPRPPPPETPVPEVVEPPVDVGPAPCRGAVALHFGDLELGERGDAPLGHAPAWSRERHFELTVENRCAQDVFLLGDPSRWIEGEGWQVASFPPPRIEAGARVTFTLRFAPGDSGLSQAMLRVPHTSGGPLTRPLSVVVDPPRPILLYGPGRRITLTTDAGATYAVDGWENENEHDDTLQRGGCWGPQGFVTVGGNALRATWQSADGLSWTPSDDGPGWIGGCAGSPELYVAAGGAGALALSADGVRWTHTHSDFGSHLRDVAYGDGAFVAVGAGRTSTTFDGQGWAVETETAGLGLARVGFAHTLDGTATFVATGESGWVATSTDHGATWVHQQVGAGSFGGRVLHVGGRFLISNGSALYTSADGFSWSLLGASNVTPLAGAGRLVIGIRGTAIWRSTDAGQTWREVLPAAPGPGFLGGVVAGGEE